VPVPR